MSEQKYTVEKMSFLRKMVRASASATRKKNAIHSMTEVDISRPLELISRYKEKTGEKLSFTGYLTASLASALKDFPRFNSFISGNKLIVLKNMNISILMERKIGGEYVPEPLVINSCRNKDILAIHREIRKAQAQADEEFGSLNNFALIRFIPDFLLKAFVSLADGNRRMAVKYGKIAITSVGMFSKEPVWFLPHGTATVLMTVGSMIERVVESEGGYEKRKHLCLTVSFDHDIIDGAPAARFMDRLVTEIKSGEIIADRLSGGAP